MLSFLKKKKQVLEVVWDTPHSQKQKLVDEAYQVPPSFGAHQEG